MTWAGETSTLIATRICPLASCYVQAAGMRSKGTYLLRFIKNHLCVRLVCLGRRACHNAHVKVRGQLSQELVSFFHLVGSGGQTWVIRHGGKCPYSLGHLGSPSVFKTRQTASLQIGSPTSHPFRSPSPCAEAKVRGSPAFLRALDLEAAMWGYRWVTNGISVWMQWSEQAPRLTHSGSKQGAKCQAGACSGAECTGGNATLETRSLELTGSLKPWHRTGWKPQV